MESLNRKELNIPASYIGDAAEVGKILDATQNGFYSAEDIPELVAVVRL